MGRLSCQELCADREIAGAAHGDDIAYVFVLGVFVLESVIEKRFRFHGQVIVYGPVSDSA